MKRTMAFGALLALVLLVACEDSLTPQLQESVRLAEIPNRTLTIQAPANGSADKTGAIVVKDGEPLAISATPDSGYTFVRWLKVSGDGTVEFDDDLQRSTNVRVTGGDATITPAISNAPRALTLGNDGNGSTNPSGAAVVFDGVPTAISATPSTGYNFDEWVKTGGAGAVSFDNSSAATANVTVTGGDATIEARFVLKTYTITVESATGGGASPGSVVVSHGLESSNISATPNTGYNFAGWQVTSGSGVSFAPNAAASTVRVTATGGNATIEATWDDVADPSGTIAVDNLINVSGTDYRNNRTVDISLTYTDNSGSVPSMKLSASTFAEGTTTGWQPATLSTTYTFPSDGAKTIYVRFRDAEGNESPLYTDSVYIDSTGPTLGWFQIRQSTDSTTSPWNNIRDYVTGITSSDIRLLYDANDSGSGVDRVYFSNSSTRPGSPQITNYTEPTLAYNWEIRSVNNLGNYGGDHTVYVWFEDRLGNISGPFTDTVRYDDKYEQTFGNNDVDAVSGATFDMITSADRAYQSLQQFDPASNDATYLIDPDVYKFGFAGDEWEAQVSFFWNTIGPDPRVRFYYYNWDAGDVIQINPGTPTDPSGFIDERYTFYFPSQTLEGQEYYYLFVVIDRTSSAPYSDSMNYQLWWEFIYVGM